MTAPQPQRGARDRAPRPGRAWSSRRCARATGLLLGLTLLATPVAADEPADDDTGPFEVVGTMDVIPDAFHFSTGGASGPLVLWPEGRRAYQLAEQNSNDLADIVVPIDLDTLEPITRTGEDGTRERVDSGVLEPGGLGTSNYFLPQREIIAIDHDRGRMFYPHRRVRAAGAASGVPLVGVDDPTCRAGGITADPVCLGGIHALDLHDDALPSVELPGPNPIPFQPIGVDATLFSPVLRAMSHTDLGGGDGKLHLLVEEAAHWLHGIDKGGQDLRVPTYIFQIDVATGRTDWVEPAPGCVSYRGLGDHRTVAAQPRNVIFASPAGRPPAVFVGCYGGSQVGSVGRVRLDPETLEPTTSEAFPGPGFVVSIQADPASQRVWLKSLLGTEEVWWVFDGGVGAYLGVVGIDDIRSAGATAGRTGRVDPATGRLYVMEARVSDNVASFDGGLFVADGRRVPVPQARIFRDLPMDDLQHVTARDPDTGEVDYVRDDDGARTGTLHANLYNPMEVDPAGPDRPRRLFFRPGENAIDSARWYVIADRLPVADEITDPEALEAQAVADPPSTDDVALADGLIRTTYTGTARGYGLRTILLGGTDAATIPPGLYTGYQYVSGPELFVFPKTPHPCGGVSREFVFGLSGATDVAGQPRGKLERGSTSSAASPAIADPESRRDLADPVGRCGEGAAAFLRQIPELAGATLDDLGVRDPEDQVAALADETTEDLGVRDPSEDVPAVDEEEARPGYDGEVFDRGVECSAPTFGEDGQVQPSSSDSSGDGQMVGPTFTAEVSCEDDVVTSGSSRARFVSAGPVSVADSYSEYEVVREPDTGRLVGTARAYARGIEVVQDVTGPDGEVVGTSRVKIDKVETRAVAWATGRGRPADEPGGCEDTDRTAGAGTCLQRTITGMTVVDGRTGETHHCEDFDQCPSNEQIVSAMKAALGDQWNVKLREPDALLAAGFDNGTLAGLQKREVDEFADTILKFDLIRTLPGLELVRYNDNMRGRGRQVYQFAGVELSTTFTRQCLGIVEGEACVAPPVPLAQVEVNLTDGLDGSPLAGGRFELAQTSAVSGATPLDSPVSCTTNATGRCELVALPAGSYTLRQTDAPGDYAPAEPLSLDLSPGSVFDVSVTNVREVGSVVAGLTDLDGVPLAGGMFELHADVDGDGTVGLDDPQVDVCTTGADGTCTMADLPLGAYVLSQSAAPDGYAAVDDQVPFVLDVPGQTATIGYSNAPAGSGASGSGSLGAVTELPPTQPVAVERPPGAEGPQVADPQASSALPRAPLPQQLAETWQLLRRNPVQAAAFGLLLALAAAAVAGPMRRRRLLLTAG